MDFDGEVMKYLIAFLAAVIAIVNSASKKRKRVQDDAIARAMASSGREQPNKAAPRAQTAPSQPLPVERVSEKRREMMQRAEQWRYAKTKQDDAEQLHSIKMDSCERRLDSLRVLYNAGILDREEFEQRVSRVKAAHRGA